MAFSDLFKPNVEKLERNKNIDGLVKSLKYPDRQICKNSADALIRLHDPATVTKLTAILQDKKLQEVHPYVNSILGKYKTQSALELLLPQLHSQYYQIYGSAISALGNIGNKDTFKEIAPYLYDSNVNVRYTAMEALIKIDPDKAIDEIIFLTNSSDERDRFHVMFLLKDVDNVKALDVFRKCLNDPHGSKAKFAHEYLANSSKRMNIPYSEELSYYKNKPIDVPSTQQITPHLQDPDEDTIINDMKSKYGFT